MGNRAVITTERNLLSNSGLGVYLHWNGVRDSVQGFLEYCRLRSWMRSYLKRSPRLNAISP